MEDNKRRPGEESKPEQKRSPRRPPTPEYQLHKDGKSALVPVWATSEWVWARVDLADLDRVVNRRWRLDSSGYPVCTVYDVEAKKATHIALHRLITHAPQGVIVDHKRGNKLDARRISLRFATHQQNSANRRRARRKFSSKYRGVTLHKGGRWQAGAKQNDVFHYAGLHDTQEQAARAYNGLARKLWGRFAVMNRVRRDDINNSSARDKDAA